MVRHQPITSDQAPTELIVVWNRVARHTGGGFAVRCGDTGYVVVDPDLDGPLRRCVLAHEIVHLERGLGTDHLDAPTTWTAVVAREEHQVQQGVADRLIDHVALRRLCRAACAGGEPVSAEVVATLFDVTNELAQLALDRLARANRQVDYVAT
jgi:hypothetical protein